MRDLGLDYYWDDPYTTNRFARGFEFNRGDTFAAATAIEVLEHVADPLTFLRAAFADTHARAVVATTTLYEGEVPPRDWWYYQFETGQHISFMTLRTLHVIADKLGCRLHSRGVLHAFAEPGLAALPFRLATSRLYVRQLRRVSRNWVSLTGSDSELMKQPFRERP